MCHTSSVHPFLFHRGCGGGVAVLPQETLTSVCICCLVASLSVVPLEGLGGTQKLPSRLDKLLLCTYSWNLTQALPSGCGIEPLTAVCVMLWVLSLEPSNVPLPRNWVRSYWWSCVSSFAHMYIWYNILTCAYMACRGFYMFLCTFGKFNSLHSQVSCT